MKISPSKKMDWLHPIIMAGGKGERLWPLSRKKKPKQFLSLTGKDSLIVSTFKRITETGDISKKKVVFSTSQDQKQHILQQFPYLSKKDDSQIIVEPMVRDTACAILLAAMTIGQKNINGQKNIDDDDVLFFLPSDAAIDKNDLFFQDVCCAAKLARSLPSLVLLGITPTRPSTSYGYLRTEKISQKEKKELKDLLENNGFSDTAKENFLSKKVLRVSSFVEKPNPEKAKKYLQAKKYLWNAGMFFVQYKFLIDLFEKYAPNHFDLLSNYLELLKKNKQKAAKDCFSRIEKISFDFAIAEKMKEDIYVVPSSFKWDDLGSLAALQRILPVDKNGNLILGNAHQFDCKNIICDARNSKSKIILHKLKDSVIIATDDVTYIANKEDSEEVKKVIAQITKDGMTSII